MSSCIWSPQIGQTLSAHGGWNQRKNAKGQLVESMPITSISPVYPIDLSYPPEMVGFIPLIIGFIPLLNPYVNWFGGCGSQHGNDMQWCCQNSTPQSSWNEMKYRMLPRFGHPEAGVQKIMDDDGKCPLQAGPCRGFSTSDFDIHLVIEMLKTIAQTVLRDLREHCR